MDFPAADEVRHCLAMYERSIEETPEHFPHPGSHSASSASAPFAWKCRTLALLEPDGEYGGEHEALVREYERISRNLTRFIEEMGPEYHRLLMADLRTSVQIYQAAICRFQIGQTGPDILCELSRREVIEELCRVLRNEPGCPEIEDLVTALQEGLDATAPSLTEGLPDKSRPCGRTRADEAGGCGYCTVTRSAFQRACSPRVSPP